MRGRSTRRLFNSNNFATSAALAEVYALLSAVLVISCCFYIDLLVATVAILIRLVNIACFIKLVVE